MSKEFPRRRDVRKLAMELFEVLNVQYVYNNNGDFAFDCDFLTDVRDLMREGIPFADAVMIAGDTEKES